MILRFKRGAMTELILLLLVYGICIALAGALWMHPAALAGCYIVVGVLALIRWHSKADVVSYAVAAVLGPLGEAFAIYCGAWTYANSALLFPIWLPLLWGVAGLFLRRFSRLLADPEPRGK